MWSEPTAALTRSLRAAWLDGSPFAIIDGEPYTRGYVWRVGWWAARRPKGARWGDVEHPAEQYLELEP